MNHDNIADKVKDKAYTQQYTTKPKIEGVKIIPTRTFAADEGDFSEVARFNPEGELDGVPGFKVAQINRSNLYPASIKAWHFHYNQDEVWYVSPKYQLFVGLWDVRKDSPTSDAMMRLNLGGSNPVLLYIPRGVAHGSANFSKENVQLMYLVSNQFNPQDPDERRLPWDTAGADFWKPERD